MGSQRVCSRGVVLGSYWFQLSRVISPSWALCVWNLLVSSSSSLSWLNTNMFIKDNLLWTCSTWYPHIYLKKWFPNNWFHIGIYGHCSLVLFKYTSNQIQKKIHLLNCLVYLWISDMSFIIQYKSHFHLIMFTE